MKTVKYINPDGVEVEVPEADAPHFDAMGWDKAPEPKGKAPEPKGKNKNKNNEE